MKKHPEKWQGSLSCSKLYYTFDCKILDLLRISSHQQKPTQSMMKGYRNLTFASESKDAPYGKMQWGPSSPQWPSWVGTGQPGGRTRSNRTTNNHYLNREFHSADKLLWAWSSSPISPPRSVEASSRLWMGSTGRGELRTWARRVVKSGVWQIKH